MNKAITIIQLATPNIDSFAKYSIASVNYYSKKFGYGHQVLREKTINDLHINWTKIDFLIKTLDQSDADFVLLMDADALIVNVQKPLEEFYQGGEKYEIFMPRDTPFISGFFRPNAGFILVRNSSIGKEIIRKWLSAAQNEGKHISDVHPRNQNVYWKYVMPQYRGVQKLLPRHYFRKPWKITDPKNGSYRFLYHVTNTDDEIRSLWMEDFYSRFIKDEATLKMVSDKLDAQNDGIVKLN